MTRRQLIQHLSARRVLARIPPREDLEAWPDAQLESAYRAMADRMADDYNHNRRRTG